MGSIQAMSDALPNMPLEIHEDPRAPSQRSCQIAGHRQLDVEEIARVNCVKSTGEHLKALLEMVSRNGGDPRNIAIARTHFEDGCMRLVRAITKPETFARSMLQLANGSAADSAAVETMRPLGNYVLVRRFKPEEKSTGGVLIPDTVQREQKKTNPIALVIAVGPGLPMDGGLRYPMDVRPGDKVQLLRTLAEAVLDGVPEETEWLVDVGQILGVVGTEEQLQARSDNIVREHTERMLGTRDA